MSSFMASCRKQPAEHSIRLSIRAELKNLRAPVLKAGFGIESDRSRVTLPDAEPHRVASHLPCRFERLRHQALCNSHPMSRPIDVEAVDLDWMRAHHDRRRLATLELRIAHQLATALGEHRD